MLHKSTKQLPGGNPFLKAHLRCGHRTMTKEILSREEPEVA
jgi:hypothetical protein